MSAAGGPYQYFGNAFAWYLSVVPLCRFTNPCSNMAEGFPKGCSVRLLTCSDHEVNVVLSAQTIEFESRYGSEKLTAQSVEKLSVASRLVLSISSTAIKRSE
jgi:hypothetical protein